MQPVARRAASLARTAALATTALSAFAGLPGGAAPALPVTVGAPAGMTRAPLTTLPSSTFALPAGARPAVPQLAADQLAADQLAADQPAADQPAADQQAGTRSAIVAVKVATVAVVADPAGGYWEVGEDGSVFAYGGAPYLGGANTVPTAGAGSNVVAMAATPDGRGYWQVTMAGAVYAFGDAPYLGGVNTLNGGTGPGTPVVGIAASGPDGYWLAGGNGAVATFGQARFFGDASGVAGSAGPGAGITAMATTSDRDGYWLLGADGGIFAYGDARYLGGANTVPGAGLGTASEGSSVPTAVSLAPTPDGRGYWEVASDGSVFAYGDAAYAGGANTLMGIPPAQSITGAATSGAGGYWEVARLGTIYAFGNAPYAGDDGTSGGSPPVAERACKPVLQTVTDAGSYAVGSPVTVTLAFRNPSASPCIDEGMLLGGCGPAATARDGAGTVVWSSFAGPTITVTNCPAETPRSISAGATVWFRRVWHQDVCALSPSTAAAPISPPWPANPDCPQTQVPAGSYTITGMWPAAGPAGSVPGPAVVVTIR